jgi:hypothetical protein
MNDNFNQHCRRRPHTSHIGAGSGGDPGVQEDGSGSRYLTSQKDVYVVGNAVHLQTCSSADNPGPYLIEMLAMDSGDDNGRIEMRGSTSVRITSGVPEGSGGPKISNKATNGIVVRAGDGQVVAVSQGCDDNPGNLVLLNHPSTEGILIKTETKITLYADAGIELSVAGGTSSITLTPSGIVMKGPIIRIN